jgi:hypothetical protein
LGPAPRNLDHAGSDVARQHADTTTRQAYRVHTGATINLQNALSGMEDPVKHAPNDFSLRAADQ